MDLLGPCSLLQFELLRGVLSLLEMARDTALVVSGRGYSGVRELSDSV